MSTREGFLVLAIVLDLGSREDARRAIFPFIEGWDDRERLHSRLGYVSPVEYEAIMATREKGA